jgi:hypothetical protein
MKQEGTDVVAENGRADGRDQKQSDYDIRYPAHAHL